MQVYKTFPPSKYLSKYIDCYWLLEIDDANSCENVHRYLPTGCQELLINFGKPWEDAEVQGTRLPQFSISGQFTRQRTFRTYGTVHVFSINFKPYGWSLLTGYSAAEFSDTMTDATLLKGVLKELPLKLGEARTEQEKIKIANHELQNLADKSNLLPTDIPIEEIIKSLHASRGMVSVKELANNHYISLSKLERNFKDLVGLTIKQYSKIVRLQHILKLYPRSENWSNYIFDLGYYDQAHFIKEFKFFTSFTPRKYIQQPKNIVESSLLREFIRLNNSWR